MEKPTVRGDGRAYKVARWFLTWTNSSRSRHTWRVKLAATLDLMSGICCGDMAPLPVSPRSWASCTATYGYDVPVGTSLTAYFSADIGFAAGGEGAFLELGISEDNGPFQPVAQYVSRTAAVPANGA
jgi:hypothetical protein